MGRYLPARVVDNESLSKLTGADPQWIWEKCGVRERRWADVAAGETATVMAAAAAREALAEAGLEPSDLDLILNASGTPEQVIPDNAPLVQDHLGLGDSGIPAYSVHATCLSFVCALDAAATAIAADRADRVLVVSSDVGSIGLDYAEPESATLIGDAAAAAVLVRPAPGEDSAMLAYRFETYGIGAHLTEIRGCGSHRPPNDPKTTPDDNRFHMRGPEVLKLTKRRGPGFLDRLWSGLTRGGTDISMVIPHQASRAGVELFGPLGYGEERVATTLSRLGNCVAASIPATLYEVLREGRVRRGDTLLLVGTGAGLSLGGAVLRY